MTSAINPQNIDGAYPVAGQDNDSQGFRDNFTNIKTNFQFAAAEITDLQNNAVLKSALTGTTLNNNMGGSILSNAQLQDMSETRVALGSTSGTITLNYAAGPYYTVSTLGSVTVSFTNFPNAGTVGRIRLQIAVASTAHTLILPAAVSVGVNNIQGYASNVISFGQTGTYEFEFETNDGGSTISIFDLNRNRDPQFMPSFESVTANSNLSLAVTTSVIDTTASITGNLAAGADGQIKILAFGNASAGNCLVTVTNAAWGGSNIANLSAVGSAATLQYIDNKWFCVGNNGVTFT
jgi:hypothetical protein